MYNKDRGELLYSPQRGHYYENDDKHHKKNVIIVVLILLFSALSGYLAYVFINTAPTPLPKIIKQKETIVKVEKTTEIIKKPVVIVVEQNISKEIVTKKIEQNNNSSKKSNETNITQEPILNRGSTQLFFTSMGKSVDGAKIEQNIQKVELKVVDTKKIRKELSEKEKKKSKSKGKSKKITIVKVKSGDTIYRIAKKVYGDSRKYKIILKANGITKPNSLKIGQILKIPHD